MEMEQRMDREYIIRVKGNPVKVQAARDMRKQPTPAEDLLWEALRGKHLGTPQFRRQQLIRGLIVDFYCHSARLVVEVDGPGDRGSPVPCGVRPMEKINSSAKQGRSSHLQRALGCPLAT